MRFATSRFFARILLAAAFVLPGQMGATAASADTLDIRDSDNAIWLAGGGSRLDYGETFRGQTLDTEKGNMPAIDFGASLLTPDYPGFPLSNLYFRLQGRATFGRTKYNGALCDNFGNCTPDQGRTNNRIYEGSMRLGRAFPFLGTMLVTPYTQLGYRRWNRDLLGPGGLDEIYRNGEILGGLLFQYEPAPRWVLSWGGGGGRTFDASMVTGGETFNLRDRELWRAEGQIGFFLTERLEATWRMDYLNFQYGASSVDGNGFFEPDSKTEQTTTMLGLAYHF